jgi:hypothetical protein
MLKRYRPAIVAVCGMALAALAPATAQQAPTDQAAPRYLPTDSTSGSSAGHASQPLAEQIDALRREIALTKLQLDTAVEELGRVRDFLATQNLDQQFEQWKAERANLLEQRLRLRRERHRLEEARRALHQATVVQAQQEAKAQQDAADAAAEAVEPSWSVQYMLGFIHQDAEEELFVKVHPTTGRVHFTRRRDLDPDNVMVRGTFLNRSAAPWRYTFEIRIGGEAGISSSTPVIGKWRYQTPLLTPGQLHAFEVKVPVDNAYSVEVVQIGNITADRPAVIPAEVAEN